MKPQSEHQSTGFSALGEAQPNAKHTPLPWRLATGGEIYGPSIFIGSDEVTMRIAAIGAGGLYRNNMQAEVDEADANARLIVVAVNERPTLLRQRDELADWLGRVLDRIDKQHQDERSDWTENDAELFNQARASLANCEKET